VLYKGEGRRWKMVWYSFITNLKHKENYHTWEWTVRQCLSRAALSTNPARQ